MQVVITGNDCQTLTDPGVMYWRVLLYVAVFSSSLVQFNDATEPNDLSGQCLTLSANNQLLITSSLRRRQET